MWFSVENTSTETWTKDLVKAEMREVAKVGTMFQWEMSSTSSHSKSERCSTEVILSWSLDGTSNQGEYKFCFDTSVDHAPSW